MSSISIDVDLNEFDDDDIIERALELIDDEELVEETELRGYTVDAIPSAPRNIDIVSENFMNRFLDGFDNIDKNELEEFLKSQNI